jgi:GT2 family glycosyltransferase
MKFSIIIPVFNKFNFTRSCLNDLSKLPSDTHEIIIVDNASSDETKDEISKLKNIVYIRNSENEFHSKACNKGFAATTGNIILFLNNDIKVRGDYSNWTNKLIQPAATAIIGCSMGQLDNKMNFVQESKAELPGRSYLSGWFLSSSRENWNKLDVGNGQIFNERYPFYFNDSDLSFRAKKLGLPLKVINLPIVHFGKISAKQINVPKLYSDAKKVFVNEWSKK